MIRSSIKITLIISICGRAAGGTNKQYMFRASITNPGQKERQRERYSSSEPGVKCSPVAHAVWSSLASNDSQSMTECSASNIALTRQRSSS